MHIFRSGRARLSNNSFRIVDLKNQKVLIGTVILVALVGLVFARAGGGPEDAAKEATHSPVETMPLSALSESASANVVMRSETEAAVRAEAGGKVSRVPAKAGSAVAAGTVLAEVENSAQRAALTQAEGALEAAKIALEKVRRGLRSEKVATLETGLDSAKGGAVTALLNAYASVDSAVENTADKMFTDIELGSPNLRFLTSNATRESEAERMRSELVAPLARQKRAAAEIKISSDLVDEIARTEAELRETRTFMDTLLAALAEAIPSDAAKSADIAAFIADATAARASLTTTLSGLVGAHASIETAKNNLEEARTGAENTDIAAAEAAVKQAEGAYGAALSAYQKTIVRSPVAGTVRVVNVALGDYLQPGQEIAIVAMASSAPSESRSTRVPLSALKLEVDRSVVFVVDNGRLAAIPVELGAVSGDSVEIAGALSADMRIVIDARGLMEGDEVSVE